MTKLPGRRGEWTVQPPLYFSAWPRLNWKARWCKCARSNRTTHFSEVEKAAVGGGITSLDLNEPWTHLHPNYIHYVCVVSRTTTVPLFRFVGCLVSVQLEFSVPPTAILEHATYRHCSSCLDQSSFTFSGSGYGGFIHCLYITHKINKNIQIWLK